jgi:hypothetical protein
MQFITLDLKFIITSLVLKFMKITETKMKEQENEPTIHTIEQNIWPRKPSTKENPARR